MKDQETKEKFQQLRAEGLSFDKIAKELDVSKPTLIAWNREYKTEIEDLKAIRYEQILEKYKATRENRIERIAKELEKAWKIYESKDYKDLSKREILMMIVRLERRLREETEHVFNSQRNNKEEPDDATVVNIKRSIISRDPETGEIITTPDEKADKEVILKKYNS